MLSPNPSDAGVWNYQNAWFHIGKFDKGITADYKIKSKGKGVYVFVVNGNITIDYQQLNTRDGFGIWNTEKILIRADDNAEFLVMEVPMNNYRIIIMPLPAEQTDL
ncbi:pirin family protein [Stygiobacter electus]|uniref:pirin family protein n=1 Tax=Stygiobacter electus TaxID=3032292 RepID=UPI0037099AF1